MADFLSTLMDHSGTSGGDAGGSSSSFDLSKVLNVDAQASSTQTNYSDHANSSQDHSVVDNGSEQSQSYDTASNSGDHGGSSTSYESHDQDFGGSSSDSSQASHNIDYSSHSFEGSLHLDSSLDALSSQMQHHDGGLLGAA